jgi:hypothetical protein
LLSRYGLDPLDALTPCVRLERARLLLLSRYGHPSMGCADPLRTSRMCVVVVAVALWPCSPDALTPCTCLERVWLLLLSRYGHPSAGALTPCTRLERVWPLLLSRYGHAPPDALTPCVHLECAWLLLPSRKSESISHQVRHSSGMGLRIRCCRHA